MIDDWNDIRFFLAVAKTGKLGMAAEQLGVDHSTVFRKLNKLEETLGSKLFQRHKQGYQLTIAGRAMLAHGERMAAEFDHLNLNLAGSDVRPEGKVRITSTHSVAEMLVAPLLVDFFSAYPGIKLSLNITARNFDLSRYQADVAVRATAQPPQHLIGRKLGTYRWLLFGSKAYLNEHGRPQSIADLKQHRVLVPDGELASIRMMSRLNQYLEPLEDHSLAANDLHFVFVAVIQGVGLGLMPEYFAHQSQELVALELPEVESSSDLWLLTHPEQASLARIKALTDFLFERITLRQLNLGHERAEFSEPDQQP